MVLMGYIKSLLVGVVFFFTFLGYCYAEECDEEKMEKLASLVNIHTEFDDEAAQAGIIGQNMVTISGMDSAIYAATDDMSVVFTSYYAVNGNISMVVPYGVNTLKFYATSCPDKVLRTEKLDLKIYNTYADDTLCKDIGDKLDVCQKYLDTRNLSYSQFESKVRAYLKKSGTSTVSEKLTFQDIVKKYFYIFILVGVVLVIGIIYLIIRKIKKDKLD